MKLLTDSHNQKQGKKTFVLVEFAGKNIKICWSQKKTSLQMCRSTVALEGAVGRIALWTRVVFCL